jgi:hypothetical protein
MSIDGFDNHEAGDLAEIKLVRHGFHVASESEIFLNGFDVSDWVTEIRYEVNGNGDVPIMWMAFPANLAVVEEK